MSTQQTTMWDPDPHTLAKHRILRSYLQAWIPILSRTFGQEPLFVDGFAGPGIYSNGEDGSPIIAIKAILEHSMALPVPMRFLFIESDPERFASLETCVAAYRSSTHSSSRIKSIRLEPGECNQVLCDGIAKYDELKRDLGPAFFFLDQFGYSGVPMDLIARIMQHRQCEVFAYLNWEKMNRFMSDATKHNALNNAFGCEEWRTALGLEGEKRQKFILKTYINSLKTKGFTKYVWHFGMKGRNHSLLNWLFFCTNNLRGLDEMKRAMMRTDQTGRFQFCDGDSPLQPEMLEVYTDEWLANHLSTRLAGQDMTVFEVKEFVLEQTPMFLYKGALKKLEFGGRLSAVNPPVTRRKGTFVDEQMRVKFA